MVVEKDFPRLSRNDIEFKTILTYECKFEKLEKHKRRDVKTKRVFRFKRRVNFHR